jgi:hypothetical protein
MRQDGDAACKADYPRENTQKSDHDFSAFTSPPLEMTGGFLVQSTFAWDHFSRLPRDSPARRCQVD